MTSTTITTAELPPSASIRLTSRKTPASFAKQPAPADPSTSAAAQQPDMLQQVADVLADSEALRQRNRELQAALDKSAADKAVAEAEVEHHRAEREADVLAIKNLKNKAESARNVFLQEGHTMTCRIADLQAQVRVDPPQHGWGSILPLSCALLATHNWRVRARN